MMMIIIAAYGGEKTQLLHTAWIAALIFMALFLAAAAAEFIFLDIPEIFALESGMAVRKRMRRRSRGAASDRVKPETFVIEREIVIVHTDERIDGA